MSLLFENNAVGTLASPITATALLCTLNAGQATLFPSPTAPDVFYATLTDAATETQIEIVQVTAVSGNIFSIVRGQDGTTAQAFLAGDFISQRTTALELRLLNGTVPSGGIILWSGSIATIPSGWFLCNGSNGTPNLQDQFVVGAGNTYTVGSTGGATSVTLSLAQLPTHTHGVNDPTHVHGVNDPTHVHGVNDPTHLHGQSISTNGTLGSSARPVAGDGSIGQTASTLGAVTGITIAAAATGITIAAAATGISIQNAGSSSPVPILPLYYALAYIMKA